MGMGRSAPGSPSSSGGDCFVILEDSDVLAPAGQVGEPLRSPVPQGMPLGQFPTVTKLMHIVCPASRARSRSGRWFRRLAEATSVFRTMRLKAGWHA
jgi:hypothetical protein